MEPLGYHVWSTDYTEVTQAQANHSRCRFVVVIRCGFGVWKLGPTNHWRNWFLLGPSFLAAHRAKSEGRSFPGALFPDKWGTEKGLSICHHQKLGTLFLHKLSVAELIRSRSG